MNAKLFFKTVFLIAILFVLVLMGMYNQDEVKLFMPPWFFPKSMPKMIEQKSAIMYFSFFAIGVLTGTILTAGGKKGGGTKSSKVEK